MVSIVFGGSSEAISPGMLPQVSAIDPAGDLHANRAQAQEDDDQGVKGKLLPNSKELKALENNLLPYLSKCEAGSNGTVALHTSLICLKMLADPNETLDSTFSELVNIEYVTTTNDAYNALVALTLANAVLNYARPEYVLSAFENGVPPEDMEFVKTMYQLRNCLISLPDAIDLASAVAQDRISARVWRANQKNPQIVKVLLRDPSLVTATALARMMFSTDYTDPNALVSVFESAKNDLGLDFEDTVNFWKNISYSLNLSSRLLTLKLTNDLLRSQLAFPEICEVATDLISKRKSFMDIQEELPIILVHQPDVDKFLARLACLNIF
jgi:hypothetical protein